MVDTRTRWLELMLKIADPILLNLAEGKLRERFPAVPPEREPYTLLEALGRTLTGMAPWLELKSCDKDETKLIAKYGELARKCIDNATSPHSPDRMNFTEGYGQALVDAAFLAHAIVRAPESLFRKLEPRVKENLADCFRATRKFKPYESNWLFFSAMVECALYVMGESYLPQPIEKALSAFRKWYKGDGAYGDGEFFCHDYYNSYVIHPMHVDILRTFAPTKDEYAEELTVAEARAARYAGVLERMIAPDGTYPPLGRSICYRFGAFHALAQAAYREYLPSYVSPAMARCALDAVITRTEQGGLFGSDGFLRVGLYGEQPKLAEHYISVGSLYLCESVFLPLGLERTHAFWASPDEKFTSQKIWSGENILPDCALDK